MFSAADLPDIVPLFPLPGAIVLPRGHLPLQIFEPRYLAMLEDALKTPHRFIGMIQPLGQDERNLHAIGSAGRVSSFAETDDGRYMITLTGISRFRIIEEIDGFTAYRRARVSWTDFHSDLARSVQDTKFQRQEFLALLRRYLSANELSTDWDSLKEAGDEILINSLSMMCPFQFEDKQALLEAPTLADRRETLVTLMEYALHSGSNGDVMQ